MTDYKASSDYKNLAESTRDQRGKWLDRIGEYFGDLSIAQFDRPEKIKPVIRRWRNQWADRPRTGDYAMQVLARVVAHAVDPLGKIAGNPCEGIKRLYDDDRSDIIWTDSDIAHIKQICSVEIADAPGSYRLYRLAARRLAAVVLVARRRRRHHPHHRQEQPQARRDHPALRCAARCSLAHPEAGDHDLDQQRAAALDGRWFRQLLQPALQ